MCFFTRFVADSPGFWFLHCHTEFHAAEGMSLVLKVGDVGGENPAIKPPPAHMRTAGSFDWTAQEFEHIRNFPKLVTLPAGLKVNASISNRTLLTILCAVFGATTVCLIGLLMMLLCHYRMHKGYAMLLMADPTYEQVLS